MNSEFIWMIIWESLTLLVQRLITRDYKILELAHVSRAFVVMRRDFAGESRQRQNCF